MFVVPDVLAVQEVPSVEVRRVPDPPPVTKSPFPYVTLLRLFVVPEVLEFQEVPSGEVRMVPELPTATNNGLDVVVVLSVVVLVSLLLLLLQEMIVRLKREMRIMYKTLFIFFLHQ